MVCSILPRILCVDDDAESCRTVGQSLNSYGLQYDLMCATDVFAAFDLISSQTFDLYILEYCLPKITGAQLCQRIRAAGKMTPVILYSALFREIDRETAISSGANSYLIKPDELDKLPTTISRLLSPAPSISRHHRPGRHAAGII